MEQTEQLVLPTDQHSVAHIGKIGVYPPYNFCPLVSREISELYFDLLQHI